MKNCTRSLLHLVTVFACFSCLTPLATAQEEATQEATASRSLKKELKAFEPFVGNWEFDGEWAAGNKLWARNEYRVGMNGNFFEARTFSKNQHGKVYQRYLTIWRYNPEKEKVESYGFSYDGTVTITDSNVDTTDPERPLVSSTWTQPTGVKIKQEVQYQDAESYTWKVWSGGGDDDMKQIMDGIWKKVK